jgi:sterol desaturase/sphingolipid hydroxylase (fatty acid hydroxylase superfamily)
MKEKRSFYHNQLAVLPLYGRFHLSTRFPKLSMKGFLSILSEFEFYLKVAIACVLCQQVYYFFLANTHVSFLNQVLLYWLSGSLSFYGVGFLIEQVIKRNDVLKSRLTARVSPVKAQQFPSLTLQGFCGGEVKSILTACIVLYLAPEVQRGNDLILNFGWFLMRIMMADLCFYISHFLFHRKSLLRFHLKHHEFQDTSSFVAAHKSWVEFIVTTITDLLPIFILGYDIRQLCAWVIVGNAYNFEGHSSLSMLFISSDFHDLHHTSFTGNYGIQGFWDKIFKTLNPPHYRKRMIFPFNDLKPAD